MNQLQQHRGPDGDGTWLHNKASVGLAHRRLSIIDLDGGRQPMTDNAENWITYGGEIYNYIEIREELGPQLFHTKSDTEVILRAYRRWGEGFVEKLRGMFAFALWDDATQSLVCARDRFGIKPFYYTVVDRVLYFASEIKTLLPFLASIDTDVEAFKDYLAFQFCLGGKTLFRGIRELPPAHLLVIRNGNVVERRYWDVYYRPDFDHSERYFAEQTRKLLTESVRLHLRSDVPVGAYVSGGTDSSIVAALAAERYQGELQAFTGTFRLGEAYDETRYAWTLANERSLQLRVAEIRQEDFVRTIESVIYHLDEPVAGPGSFPQFIVSELAARHVKVVLGGQGGDEIFGGYARYLIAYFEQCIKAAIDGTMHSGNFIVTYESIIPNLLTLRGYKPLLQEFWREGLFDELDKRYFRLVNRSADLHDEIRWDRLGEYSPYETFRSIFSGDNVQKESYFDSMTHFDFKTLLPALLHVEDRMSMAHGLESRVPFLDHPLVEFAATMPSDVKFANGEMKHILRTAFGPVIPASIQQRKDKMGFPVPLQTWLAGGGPVRDFVHDVLRSRAAQGRDLIDNSSVLVKSESESQFGRKLWGFLSLELWQRTFHDRAAELRKRRETLEVT